MFYFLIFILLSVKAETDNKENTGIKAQETLPTSVIKPGYGILYQADGILLHSLNKFNLIVGIKMPTIKFNTHRSIHYYDNWKDHCDKLNFNNGIYIICMEIWPMYQSFKNQEIRYQQIIQQLMCKDLKTMIPSYEPPKDLCALTFKPIESTPDFTSRIWLNAPKSPNLPRVILNSDSDADPELQQKTKMNITNTTETRKRKKRFVGSLLSFGFEAFKSYISFKQNKKLKKGLKLLQRRTDLLDNKIESVQDDLMAVAQATLEDMETIQIGLENSNDRIDLLATRIQSIENVISSVANKSNQKAMAIEYLAIVIGKIYPQLERSLSQYEIFISYLHNLIDALDTLSSGFLAPSVIQPGILADLINQVDQELRTTFPQYTMALSVPELYYNVPLVRHTFANDMLGVQIPLFVQHHTQKPLNLYSVQTVPVPFHVNQDIMKPDSNEHGYTWLKPQHELLAMTYSTYVPLDMIELENCFRFGNYYFCENSILTRHSTSHTCESAIFHNLDIQIIKELCNFEYYPNLDPEPKVLDSGTELLLSNLPTPWSFFCTKESQVPNDISGSSYVLIQKSDLCLCSINAQSLYLHENIATCAERTDLDKQLSLQFTINQAVAINFPDEIDLDLKEDIRMDQPQLLPIKDPILTQAKDKDVLRTNSRPIALKKVVKSILLQKLLYKSPGEKSLKIDNVDQWVKGKNKGMSFLFAGAIIGILCLALLIVLFVFHHRLRQTVLTKLHLQNLARNTPIPRIISDTFSKFRRSFRTNSNPNNRSSRPQAISLSSFRTGHRRLSKPETKVSVLAAVNKIEKLKAEERLSGLDNIAFEETPTKATKAATSASEV